MGMKRVGHRWIGGAQGEIGGAQGEIGGAQGEIGGSRCRVNGIPFWCVHPIAQ